MIVTRPQPYITRPDLFLAEGELDLGPALSLAEGPASDAPDDQLLPFVRQLLRTAAQGESNDQLPELSSISIQRVEGPLSGPIYGQAWAERRGRTVHFLRVRLIDEQGEQVLTGMATSHIVEQST
ncbi:MAG: hypothetical protein IIB42_10265 [Candidatus Marinimicrobia bacterium]|nr:hypothetical protein [Candidatus Neomarinimicrobiota bacterium]